MNEKIYDRLFLYAGDFVVYIIDHQLIGLETLTDIYYNPYKNYNYLLNLFENNKTKVVFPKSLHQYFKGMTKIGVMDCITGYDDPYCFDYCLDFSMNINESGKDVNLYNFILRFPNYVTRKITDLNINLTLNEIFYTLANIAIINTRDFFSGCQPYNSDDIFNHIMNYSDFKYTVMGLEGNNVKNAFLFTAAYLQYIKDNISNKSIKLNELLSLSGAFVIAQLTDFEPISDYILEIIDKLNTYKDLESNQVIIYYSLIKLIPRKIKNNEILKAIKNNKQLIKSIEIEYSKKFI